MPGEHTHNGGTPLWSVVIVLYHHDFRVFSLFAMFNKIMCTDQCTFSRKKTKSESKAKFLKASNVKC